MKSIEYTRRWPRNTGRQSRGYHPLLCQPLSRNPYKDTFYSLYGLIEMCYDEFQIEAIEQLEAEEEALKDLIQCY